MTSTPPAIEIVDVAKRFATMRDRRWTLKERVVRGRPSQLADFWALKGVSLTVPKGSVYGLIGHNGCGKSTLLKLTAGIYRPTAGVVHAHGRVAALIELGAGFHPEMTGRENIRLNGAILGLDRRSVAAATGEIIEFSGLGDFIDEPVKTYSSGMYVRLGFSVAVHMRPDILLIDEVIAVGDEDFQRRCFDHLYQLRRAGRTIVIVSHALQLIESLCDEVAWLSHGELLGVGAPGDQVGNYMASVNDAEAPAGTDEIPGDVPDVARSGSGEIKIVRVALVNDLGLPIAYAIAGESMRLRLWWRASEPIVEPVFEVGFHHETGAHITAVNSAQTQDGSGTLSGEGYADVVFDQGPLNVGHYQVHTTIGDSTCTHTFDRRYDVLGVTVRETPGPIRRGLVTLPARFQFDQQS